MAYKIEFLSSAQKQFSKLPDGVRRRIAEVVGELGDNPRPPGVVKLSGEERLYRMRCGNYRIVYRIEDDKLLILVIKIGHRREVYR